MHLLDILCEVAKEERKKLEEEEERKKREEALQFLPIPKECRRPRTQRDVITIMELQEDGTYKDTYVNGSDQQEAEASTVANSPDNNNVTEGAAARKGILSSMKKIHLNSDDNKVRRETLFKKPMKIQSDPGIGDDDDYVVVSRTDLEEQQHKKKLKSLKRKNNGEEGPIIKERIKNKKNVVDTALNIPAPNLPQEIMDRILRRARAAGIDNVDNGQVALVVQKTLTQSDMEPQQNRFIFSKNQARIKDFLTETEINKLKGSGNRMKVHMIEPSKKVQDVNFTIWVRGKNSESYVLNRHWGEIIKENRLTVGEIVQLWTFRINGKLNFAFVVILRPEKKKNSAPTASEDNAIFSGDEYFEDEDDHSGSDMAGAASASKSAERVSTA